MDDHAPLVVIRDFGASMEAHLAHSALEAAGIDSIVRPDDCGGMRPNLQISGVQLLVRPDDVAEAERILTADLR
jgi:Putative prokaryotic signal transducing protein